MKWPFFPRDAREPGDPTADPVGVGGPVGGPRSDVIDERSDVLLPRQPDPSTLRSAATGHRSRPEDDAATTLLADAIAEALSAAGDHPKQSGHPTAVAVLVDAAPADPPGPGRTPPGAHRTLPTTDPVIDGLLARLAQRLPVRRVLGVPAGSDPVGVRELDALADRLGGVDAVVAIGSGRTIDAGRVLAAGGRSLGTLYAGRGGSQCLLPLADVRPLVTVPSDTLSPHAAGAVVVGTDVGRLVLTGDPLPPHRQLSLPGAPIDPVQVAGATLALVGRFLGPWHGAGVPAPQRAVFDVRALLGGVLDLTVDPAAAIRSGVPARLDELGRRAARAGGPPGRPCSWWLWPVAHEWATITDQPMAVALAAVLPAWRQELAVAGIPAEQRDLWHEAAIPARPQRPEVTLTAADLQIVLRRVDRWWRPIGPGIPDADQLHRIFGLRRCPTA